MVGQKPDRTIALAGTVIGRGLGLGMAGHEIPE